MRWHFLRHLRIWWVHLWHSHISILLLLRLIVILMIILFLSRRLLLIDAISLLWQFSWCKVPKHPVWIGKALDLNVLEFSILLSHVKVAKVLLLHFLYIYCLLYVVSMC